MLWHAGIHIHFVVLMEPQSSENCAFFVLASGHKYNKIHEYPHTKVSMAPCILEINMEKRKHYRYCLLPSLPNINYTSIC